VEELWQDDVAVEDAGAFLVAMITGLGEAAGDDERGGPPSG
jgi:hypothetical protein